MYFKQSQIANELDPLRFSAVLHTAFAPLAATPLARLQSWKSAAEAELIFLKVVFDLKVVFFEFHLQKFFWYSFV